MMKTQELISSACSSIDTVHSATRQNLAKEMQRLASRHKDCVIRTMSLRSLRFETLSVAASWLAVPYAIERDPTDRQYLSPGARGLEGLGLARAAAVTDLQLGAAVRNDPIAQQKCHNHAV